MVRILLILDMVKSGVNLKQPKKLNINHVKNLTLLILDIMIKSPRVKSGAIVKQAKQMNI